VRRRGASPTVAVAVKAYVDAYGREREGRAASGSLRGSASAGGALTLAAGRGRTEGAELLERRRDERVRALLAEYLFPAGSRR
jgi:hypothetical protein